VRSRAPWFVTGVGLALIVPTLALTIRNGSLDQDPYFIPIALVIVTGWATVGALLASRNPSNPIGWLMMTFGLGFLLSGLTSELATYGYETNPGGVPLRALWAWIGSWIFIVVMTPIPALLLLYPTGTVPTARWRPLPWALIGATALAIVSTVLRTDPIYAGDLRVPNPTGVSALNGAATIAQNIAGFAYIVVLAPLCIVAVILRFRRSRGVERQQIRWLVYVALISGLAFAVAIVSSIGLEGDETNAVNEASFLAFFVAMGLGIPAAIGVALLRHRLWDLDVVLKKALVAALLVVLIMVVALVALVVAGAVLVDPVGESPTIALVIGLVIGLLAWPLLRLSRRVSDRLVYGGRATPYEVLTDFSERMAESYSTEDVLPRMASILGEGTGASAVTIWLLVGGELRPAAAWPAGMRESESRPTAALFDAEPGTFEVRHQGELLGAITARMPANDPMTPSKERLIRDLASQAGLVLRNVRLIEELRQSRRRIVAAVDEGRRRLERNIHDGAQQQLVALAVKIRLADSMVERDPAKTHELLAQLQTETTDALENLRDLARGIYPPLLADEGLEAALQAQARRSTIPVRVSPNGIGRYPQEVEATVYFCVLEALSNVTKYAGASEVDVELRRDGHDLTFEVRDDGIGFDPSMAARGTGLQGMTDRVEAIGGRLDVRSSPGSGTRVVGHVPVAAGDER
jgi:signal transduction histidine kinase